MKQLTTEWVAKAEGDYRAGLILRRAKKPEYDAICYHAQQSSEKYLKAWLVEQSTVVPKIHDLEALAKLCIPTLPELSDHIEDAIYLTSFAVEIRYPGTFATRADAQVCWRAARAIRKLLRKNLNA